MGSLGLEEDHYKKLGELLSLAVKNTTTLHVEDQRRAAVLIFSLVQKGYNFWDRELENVMELSGERFSEAADKHLKEITWVCNELVNGLGDYGNERFKLKDFEEEK
jgi:hypothetical protein